MKLFVGEVPVNPFEAEEKYMNRIRQMAHDAYAMGQKSILDQCVEMDDIEKLAIYLLHCKEIKQEKGK